MPVRRCGSCRGLLSHFSPFAGGRTEDAALKTEALHLNLTTLTAS